VGREQIRQFANAVKAHDPASTDPEAAAAMGYDGLVAPLTFVSIIAVMTQRHFFQHVDVGFETMQIVQVDQRFEFLRPVVEGDEVIATMYIDSVDERFGADIVTSRNVLTDARTGDEVMIAYTTLMGHEGETPSRPAGIPRPDRCCASPSPTIDAPL
jgi:acyl dehydratase